MNINDVAPTDISTVDPTAAAPTGGSLNINSLDPSQVQTEDQFNQDKYSTTG